MRPMLLHLLWLAIFLPIALPAQQVATSNGSDLRKPHSPHKASIYSAILPGLGQAYNRKYWKIPIVYGGFGGLGYLVSMNTTEYRLAKDAFLYVSSGAEYPTDNKYVGRYSEADLISIRDYYRRNVELSWILTGFWYLLNIVDATVDAHFFDYDISDNLSLQVQPSLLPSHPITKGTEYQTMLSPPVAGISINLKF